MMLCLCSTGVCVLQHCRVGGPLPLATGGGLTAKVRLQCAWCWCWCLDQVIHPNTVQHCRHGEVETPRHRCRDGEMERGDMAETGELTVIMLQTGGEMTTCNTLTIMETH